MLSARKDYGTAGAKARARYATEERRRAKLMRAAPTARSIAISPLKASVPDPYMPGRFETATVNRRVDILAQEFAAHRIDRAAFLVGRELQAAWEAGSGSRLGSADWAGAGSRSTATEGLSSAEVRAIRAITDARKVAEVTHRASLIIGTAGVQFLRSVMCDTHSFAGYATKVGRGTGDRAAAAVAERFRWLLKDLVEGRHTAEGAVHLDAEGQERSRIRGGAIAPGAMRRPLGPARR